MPPYAGGDAAAFREDFGKQSQNQPQPRLLGHVANATTELIMASGKKDEESGISAYYHNKTTVIQEARVFNESPINPRKCRALLTQIIYLLYAGETFGTQEATTLFFGTTKLFQHKDVGPI